MASQLTSTAVSESNAARPNIQSDRPSSPSENRTSKIPSVSQGSSTRANGRPDAVAGSARKRTISQPARASVTQDVTAALCRTADVPRDPRNQATTAPTSGAAIVSSR